jgi:DNA-binding response OmpR family regulator
MRMENDVAGIEVIKAARKASYHPAVALLTAFPMSDEDWETTGADKMLIKPMQTRLLLQQIEKLLAAHQAKLAKAAGNNVAAAGVAASSATTSEKRSKAKVKS